MNYGAWFTLFIMLFVSIIILLALYGYPSEDEIQTVMNAIEKTFPNSSFLEICLYLEFRKSIHPEIPIFSMAKIHGILEILEEDEVVARFESHSKQTDHLGLPIPVICYMVIGRWNKDKKKGVGNKQANLLGVPI